MFLEIDIHYSIINRVKEKGLAFLNPKSDYTF